MVLLRTDISALKFVAMARPRKIVGGADDGVLGKGRGRGPQPARITPAFRGLFDHLVALQDAFEDAVASGDAVSAYRCLHQASDFFLPTTTAAPAGSAAVGGGEKEEGEERGTMPQWEPIEVEDDDEEEQQQELDHEGHDDDDEDSVEIIEPATAASSLPPSFRAAASSSSSFSATSLARPFSVLHRRSPLPAGYRGLQDLPKPLIKVVVTILGR